MSEHRGIFLDTVTRVIADTLGPDDIAAAERRVPPAALIAALEETGILGMLVPEAQGGIGADTADAVAILRALGAAAAPGPLLETMLGRMLIARAGFAPGEGMIALAFADGFAGDGAMLHDVPWGGIADHVAVVLRDGEQARLIVSGSQAWTVQHGQDAAGEPRDTLAASGPLPDGVTLDLPYAELVRTAAILRAGQILGATEWVFMRSTDYAMERRQFGREIGKFQAVQQMLAELADHSLAAAVLVEAAAEGCGETLVAAARSRLGDAADAAIRIGHQVHGALGFSREYGLNHRTRRLMAWRDDHGSVTAWRRALGAGFIALDRDGFWPAVADAGLSGATA